MGNFSNSILLPENLPEVDSKTFNRLDKSYLKIMFIRIVVLLLFMSGILMAILFLAVDIPTFIVAILGGSAIVLITLFTSVITVLGFPRKGYLVREQDISFQRGLITYKLTTVPFNRIQHVEVNQGVLAKMFRLSSVKLYTAGGSMSDLSIPGLPVSDAKRLKAFLSEKISEHE
ncbi:MAG: PH domain-containing protein [Draconibacterium sp.]